MKTGPLKETEPVGSPAPGADSLPPLEKRSPLARVLRYLRLYGLFTAQHIKKLMEYKADFLIGLLGFLIFQGSGLAFVGMVFQQIDNLNGWSFDQMLLIYGMAQIPRGLDHLVTDNLWMLSGQILRKGDFDRFLLRPIRPLFQVIAEVFQPDAFGELLVGFVLLVTASFRLGISWGLQEILVYGIFVICGTLIYTCIKLFFASIAFWIKFSQSLVYLAYPMGIYSRAIGWIITFLLPFAFTAYFPAAVLLEKELLWPALQTALVVTTVLVFLSGFIWSRGIRAYESAGS